MAEDRESLCLRCGVCCHEKLRLENGDVLITDIPCPFLDEATNLCTVYNERFERQPRCSAADKSAADGALPGFCPYVRGRRGYRAPLLLMEHPEYLDLVNAVCPDRTKKKT